MPIQINLLAERQTAEEMRRKDPVKRAVFAGAALVVLFLGWAGLLQMSVRAARSDLQFQESELKRLEETSKTAKAHQNSAADGENRIHALDRYSTNRFFWGNVLDAVQRLSVENVRLMEVSGEHLYKTNDGIKLFTTNITVPMPAKLALWKFWASRKAPVQVQTLISNTFANFTNNAPFSTNLVPYNAKITLTSTNAENKVVAKVEFTTLPVNEEQIVLHIRGRDYGSSVGAGIDEFTRGLLAAPFFKTWLKGEQSVRFTERPPQPRPDPQDQLNPTGLFVPFAIECRLRERLLTNE